MAGLVATDGADQPDANLLNDQNRMLDELLNINPATVVVLKDSNPVLMPWIDKAPAVLEAWNQGAEDGHVVADLLFVAGQPPKRLVGFQKVFVEPGESKPVTVTIDPAATNHPFSVWDYCTHRFATKPGEYTVYVGNSADNTPHTTTLTVD
jgi:hypothetical protein